MKKITLSEIISTINLLKDVIKSEYRAEIVGVFGSYVRGEQKETSDVDVLVRFFEGASLFDLVGLSNFLEERLGVRVDVVPIDTIRKEIKEAVLREAVYI